MPAAASKTEVHAETSVSSRKRRRRDLGEAIRPPGWHFTGVSSPQGSLAQTRAQSAGAGTIALETARALGQRDASQIDVAEVGMLATTLGEYEILVWVVATSREALAELVRERIAPLAGVRRSEIIEYHEVFKHSYTWARLV